MLQQGQVAAISTTDTVLAGLATQDPQTKIVGPAVGSSLPPTEILSREIVSPSIVLEQR
jgi:hypothetical protein